MSDLRTRISTLLSTLESGLYEREHVMAVALLTAVAGESLFLLGPPGVAKSMIARRLKLAFREGRAFEYLMSRFSTPDEIFGPVSISHLRDDDKYIRLTKGYLPQSEIVFLDEVFKASPSIQNTLLTVLNERIFRNGDRDESMPLQLLIAASNELPAQGELDALWDRFLVRLQIDGITRDDLFDRMITDTTDTTIQISPDVLLTSEELLRWRDSIDHISVSPLVLSFIHHIRHQLLTVSQDDKESSPVYVSDRRWKKSIRILRTAAFLMGNAEVQLSDALLLIHLLWSQPTEISQIQQILTQALTQAISENAGLELAQERLDAIRIELNCGPSHSQPAEMPLRVVHSFYYQLKIRSGRAILMYTSEYNTLSGDAQPFVLLTDKLKTGAQILKRYERSKHPDVFPKDLLDVKRIAAGVLSVNGTEYPLMRDDSPSGQTATPSAGITPTQRAMLQRVHSQNLELQQEYQRWNDTELTYLEGHLFLDEDQKRLMKSALNNVTYSIRRLLVETEEVCSL